MLNTQYDVILDDLTLGAVDETMWILDTGFGHSEYQQNMNIIPNFNSNAKRWELYQGENAFNTITNQFPGYWKYVRESDTFKGLVFMPNAAGVPVEYVTSFTDTHEFIDTAKFSNDLVNDLTPDLNRIALLERMNQSAKSKISILYDSTGGNSPTYRYRRYRYNEETRSNDLIQVNNLAGGMAGAVNKYVTMTSNVAVLVDNNDEEVVFENTAPTMHVCAAFVSEREKVVACGPYSTNQILVYNTETKKHVMINLDTTMDIRTITFLTVDYAEKYCLLEETTTKWYFINMETMEVTPITLPQTLTASGATCKNTISPDGTMIAFSNATAGDAGLRIIRVSDGTIIYTSPSNYACSGVAWTKENLIYTFSTTGNISRYTVTGTAASISVAPNENYLFHATGAYSPTYIPECDRIILVKTATSNNQPLWIMLDAISGNIFQSAAASNLIGQLLSVGAKQYCHVAPPMEGETCTDIIIAPTAANNWTIIDYDIALRAHAETIVPGVVATVIRTNAWTPSPLYFCNNTIIAMILGRDNCIIYDIARNRLILYPPASINMVIKKLDDTHLAIEGRSGTTIYELNQSTGTIAEKINVPIAGKGIYIGFDGDSDINLSDD